MQEREHRLEIIKRQKLSLDGVIKVDNFDDEKILLSTTMGKLEITGHDLHVSELLLDEQRLEVLGNVSALSYFDQDERSVRQKGRGFLARLVR